MSLLHGPDEFTGHGYGFARPGIAVAAATLDGADREHERFVVGAHIAATDYADLGSEIAPEQVTARIGEANGQERRRGRLRTTDGDVVVAAAGGRDDQHRDHTPSAVSYAPTDLLRVVAANSGRCPDRRQHRRHSGIHVY